MNFGLLHHKLIAAMRGTKWVVDAVESNPSFLSSTATSPSVDGRSLPDVPTLREAGYPDLERSSFWGMWAPAGTPKEIIATLNSAVCQALADPEISRRIAGIGAEPGASSPEEMDALVTGAAEVWGPVIKRAGIKAN